MLIPVERTELCQISLTGARAIVLLGLLMENPRSMEEIRAKFLELKLIEESNSNDIIRIDMNTLKAIGCVISRSCAKTNFKYKLLKHPFYLDIEKDDIQVLKRAYKVIKDNADITTLICYDSLFKKIGNFVSNPEIREELSGFSILKSYECKELEQLDEDCKKNNILSLVYKSPVAKTESVKNVIAQKLELQNDKFYLLCYDIDKKASSMLPIKRILKIQSRKHNDNNLVDEKPVIVRFYLKNFTIAGILNEETIIKTNSDFSCEIEGRYHNEFAAIQRLLSFGSACTVLEPQEIKEKIINKLLEMKEVYKND